MTGRTKFIISLFTIVICFILFIVGQVYYLYFKGTTVRSTESLLNQYYRIYKRDPDGAKRALELVLADDPSNLVALREFGFWYLRQGDTYSAFKQFEKVHALYPQDNKVNAQLSLLSGMTGQKSPSQRVNIPLKLSTLTPINNSLSMVNIFTTKLANPLQINPKTEITTDSHLLVKNVALKTATIQKNNMITPERDRLLNEFYQNKILNPKKAWEAINFLLMLDPDDIVVLKEAGYFAMNQKNNQIAASYFEHAYDLTHDPLLALQVGYLLDGLNNKRLAYYYFDLATCARDPVERMKAEIAKTNLRGMQTKFLPPPFFANMLFYPFYRSRFKLMIYPLIARVGVVINEKYNVAVYTSYRRTSDNKSSASGQLSQIYEDNVAITALGIQATPFPSLHTTLFMEAGKAVDLVFRGRGRWRNDFRTGVVFYNDWGREARYTFKPELSAKFNADLYSDLIYFSRFLNTIGTIRARAGFEVFRFGSTSVNLYMKGFLIEDTTREFYNNVFEHGPGIAFTPSDRYNISIRYESLHGVYLPAGSPSVNPYSKTYHNNMLFLDTYIGF